jgi:hypothetical protein
MPQKTQTPTRTPTRTEPAIDPDPYYNPERLCPSQREDAERRSRP